MTDNEIIDTWEKVLDNNNEPIGEHWMVFVTTQMAKETFDMLNRQRGELRKKQVKIHKLLKELKQFRNYYEISKSEIDMLKEVTTNTINTSIEFGLDKEAQINKAKSEAIKDFAERLKKKSQPTIFCDNSIQKTRNVYYRIEEIDIDNLVKEMVGDNNG